MELIKGAFAQFRRRPAFTGFILFAIALVLNIILQGPGSFFSARSLNTLFSTGVPFLLIVMAHGVLLISGTLDISIGIQLALVNVVTIMTVQEWGIPFALGALLGIGAAVVASVVLWVLISVFRLPDLLASFALAQAIRGVNVLIMNIPQGTVPRTYLNFYHTSVLGFIPMSALILFAVGLVWIFLKRTSFGTNIYAVGANPQNAFASGISPAKVQFQAFMVKAIVTGIAGLCLTLMTGSGNPIQAEPWGLRSLAAAIIGGLTFGGWGTMACAVFGGGFLVLIDNSVFFLFNTLNRIMPGVTISSFWNNFVADAIIFLGLLTTILTVKGQRETLRVNIQNKYLKKRRQENDS